MRKIVYAALFAVMVLLLSSCNSKEHFNSKVKIEDNISLLQKATKEELLNYKCPDDVIVAIHTVDSISVGKIIKFADDLFDNYADSIIDFRLSGILILASNNPALVQMRVGENFRLMAQNYGIYPGNEYYQAQQTAYTYGVDYAVMQVFQLAIKCGKMNAELSFIQRSNQNKAAGTIYDLLSDLTTPKDSFFFNTFLKYPFKLSFFLIQKTESLINMLLLILMCILIINILLYCLSLFVAAQKKGCFFVGLAVIMKVVLVYMFITASLSAVFFIAVPATENFMLIHYFNLGDASMLSGMYEGIETGSSILLGAIFLVCFALMMITKNEEAIVYSATSPEFQRRLFTSLSKDEQRKLAIGNALNSETGASVDDFKESPFTAILTTGISRAMITTFGILIMSLFLLSKPIILVLLLIILNTLTIRIFNIITINRNARKNHMQEMKKSVNIAFVMSVSLLCVLVFVSLLSFALKSFNINYDKTKEIATAINEDWAAINKRFIEENKNAEGVISLPSGLQYKIIKKGTGKKPSSSSKVNVHYTGKFIDGTELDNSIKRGEPAIFNVNQVIKGFSEALVLMPVGSKWILYIPSELAYGNMKTETIKPHSVLIFELELLKIEK